MTDNEKLIIDTPSSFKQIRLEFPDHEIEDIQNNQVQLDAMSLEESIFDGTNIKFGKCNGSLFKIRVADFTENIENARMNVYIHFTNEELGEVDMPFGKYIIQSVERTAERRWRDITATDYMTLFDVDIADWYTNTMFINKNASYTLKEFREALCEHIGIDYADVTLINDSAIIRKSALPQQLSAKELLEMMCELNGCFGHFDWSGVLNFITLDFTKGVLPVRGYKQDACEYDDYDTKYINAVITLNEEGNQAANYPLDIGSYNYNIENNFLIFGMTLTEQERLCTNLYNSIRYVHWRPFKIDVFSKVYITLGQYCYVEAKTYKENDVIDTSFNTYIFKREIKGIQSIFSTIEAPRNSEVIENSLSSGIKALNNRLNVFKENIDTLNNKIQYYIVYNNNEPCYVDSNNNIIDIQFKTIRKSYIIFHASVTFILSTSSEETQDLIAFYDGNVEFQFIINNEVITEYVPKATYQDGTHTIHLNFSYYNEIDNEEVEQSFQVKCSVRNCAISIPTYKIHGYLTGDGLYINSGWDGRIDAEEEFENIELDILPGIDDNCFINVSNENFESYTQNINIISLDGIVSELQDFVGNVSGMIFSTIVNVDKLSHTATISNNTFINGDVITPRIHNIVHVSVASQGDVVYSVSLDSGNTWRAYVSGSWIENTTMTKDEIQNVPSSAWTGDVMIRITIADDAISSFTQLIAEGGTLI